MKIKPNRKHHKEEKKTMRSSKPKKLSIYKIYMRRTLYFLQIKGKLLGCNKLLYEFLPNSCPCRYDLSSNNRTHKVLQWFEKTFKVVPTNSASCVEIKKGIGFSYSYSSSINVYYEGVLRFSFMFFHIQFK